MVRSNLFTYVTLKLDAHLLVRSNLFTHASLKLNALSCKIKHHAESDEYAWLRNGALFGKIKFVYSCIVKIRRTFAAHIESDEHLQTQMFVSIYVYLFPKLVKFAYF